MPLANPSAKQDDAKLALRRLRRVFGIVLFLVQPECFNGQFCQRIHQRRVPTLNSLKRGYLLAVWLHQRSSEKFGIQVQARIAEVNLAVIGNTLDEQVLTFGVAKAAKVDRLKTVAEIVFGVERLGFGDLIKLVKKSHTLLLAVGSAAPRTPTAREAFFMRDAAEFEFMPLSD